MGKPKHKIYTGTSGWHYKHWKGTFYPEGTRNEEQLDYYMKFFKTVELNNPFYHLPPPATFRNWNRKTPGGFVFSVKASRFITHVKKLKTGEEPVRHFFSSVNALGDKLGPILFQLPPRWHKNHERLAGFLSLLPQGYRYTFEFRDPTWYDGEVYDLLREHNIAFCIYELAGHLSPREITADFVYVRLHGPGENKYEGSYSKATLKKWAVQCKKWQQEGKDVYLYFDNDQLGYAAFNALELSRLLET
ncbi:DUF72 domain-containing protein [Compostibacter hankyongensis]|uniref:DUF72 domain-containing protein n=1 Tax=Compostibacter hankyongensis TaxID=1007089 RepID=A0ABP8FI11_9BACT